jgi:hypothetical protein
VFSQIRFVRRSTFRPFSGPPEKSVTKLNHVPPDFELKPSRFDFHHEY